MPILKMKDVNNLASYFKTLKKGEQTKPKASQWKEVFKSTVEINEIENRKINKINETKIWSFEMIDKYWQTFR